MFIIGAALGATVMYLLDPDKGRRRRAIARDKARSVLTHAQERAAKSARDLGHRVEGVRARARQAFERAPAPDDLVLIERVRSRIGRVVSHPHAIQIGARDGRVTLSGPILTGEVQALLDAVRSVPGVSDIDEHLDAHETPGSVPSLQGTSKRSRAR